MGKGGKQNPHNLLLEKGKGERSGELLTQQLLGNKPPFPKGKAIAPLKVPAGPGSSHIAQQGVGLCPERRTEESWTSQHREFYSQTAS